MDYDGGMAGVADDVVCGQDCDAAEYCAGTETTSSGFLEEDDVVGDGLSAGEVAFDEYEDAAFYAEKGVMEENGAEVSPVSVADVPAEGDTLSVAENLPEPFDMEVFSAGIGAETFSADMDTFAFMADNTDSVGAMASTGNGGDGAGAEWPADTGGDTAGQVSEMGEVELMVVADDYFGEAASARAKARYSGALQDYETVSSSVEAQGFYSQSSYGGASVAENISYGGSRGQQAVITVSELAQAIAKAIAGIKIYVLESDITEAQKAVRAAVELSKF